MTDNEIRIAIAEKCGWVRIQCSGGKCDVIEHAAWSKDFGRSVINRQSISGLPDYPYDLNAMHEAEKVLTERQREVYADCLSSCLAWDDNTPYLVPDAGAYIGYIEMPADLTFKVYHATARQRSEAFLRTFGLWKEDKP